MNKLVFVSFLAVLVSAVSLGADQIKLTQPVIIARPLHNNCSMLLESRPEVPDTFELLSPFEKRVQMALWSRRSQKGADVPLIGLPYKFFKDRTPKALMDRPRKGSLTVEAMRARVGRLKEADIDELAAYVRQAFLFQATNGNTEALLQRQFMLHNRAPVEFRRNILEALLILEIYDRYHDTQYTPVAGLIVLKNHAWADHSEFGIKLIDVVAEATIRAVQRDIEANRITNSAAYFFYALETSRSQDLATPESMVEIFKMMTLIAENPHLVAAPVRTAMENAVAIVSAAAARQASRSSDAAEILNLLTSAEYLLSKTGIFIEAAYGEKSARLSAMRDHLIAELDVLRSRLRSGNTDEVGARLQSVLQTIAEEGRPLP